MPSTATQIGVVLATIAAAIALAGGVRRTVKDREWGWGAVLGGAMVLLTFSFVQLVVTYTDAWVKITDVFRVVTYEIPGWGHLLLRVTLSIMAVGAVALFGWGVSRRDAQVNLPAVLLILVLGISMGSALLHGDFPFRVFSLVYLCLLLACVFAPRGISVQLGIATLCVVAAIASGLALVLHQDFAVIDCVAGHKCGLLGFNFRGVQDNENALALYIALAIPFVYLGFGGWEGAVLSAYMTAQVLITGSRSGTTAAVVTFVLLLVLRPSLRRPGPTPVRSTLMSFGLAGTLAVGMILPLTVTDPSALSGRAGLWQLARGALDTPSTFFYGAGMFGWDRMRDSGLIDSSAVYSVHNQWLHVLYTTGILGLGLFLAAIAILLWQARNSYYLVVSCVLTPFVILAVTERPWPVDTADWLCWAVPGVLLSYPLLRANPPRDHHPTAVDEVPPRGPGREEVLVWPVNA